MFAISQNVLSPIKNHLIDVIINKDMTALLHNHLKALPECLSEDTTDDYFN
jgi:hypothetical protein